MAPNAEAIIRMTVIGGRPDASSVQENVIIRR